MLNDNIENIVAEIIIRISGNEQVKSNCSFKEDLNFDSFSLVLLIIEIETTLKIEFDESDLDPEKLITVGDLVELVGKYV